MASSKLTAEDYTGARSGDRRGDGGRCELRLAFVFEGLFEGTDAAAAWQDLAARVSARPSLERIAAVTEQQWILDGLKLLRVSRLISLGGSLRLIAPKRSTGRPTHARA